VRAAYRTLGLKAGSSLKVVKSAYKLLAKKNHPDLGGDLAAMQKITAGYKFLCKSLPKRGRPRKYSRHDGFAIVDELHGNEVILDGFETRKAAKEALLGLRERSKARGHICEPNVKLARYVIAGSPASQRTEGYRKRNRKPTTEYGWNRLLARLKLSVDRGLYLTDAPHGKGKIITGGFGSSKVEIVIAAHQAGELGPDVYARPVRPHGNGPDQFEATDEATDETADPADSKITLSKPDGNTEREIWEDPRHPDILGKGVDPLLGPSVEDAVLPAPVRWDGRPTEFEDMDDPHPAEQETEPAFKKPEPAQSLPPQTLPESTPETALPAAPAETATDSEKRDEIQQTLDSQIPIKLLT